MRINEVIFLFFFCSSFNLYAVDNLSIKVEEITTNKGFKFLFVEDNNLPKVSLNILFKNAGYAYEKKQCLSWFTSLIIKEGAGENGAEEFAKILEDKGIRLHFDSSKEYFGVSLDTLSENLEEGISLLSDAIMRPIIDDEGLKRVYNMVKVELNYLEKDSYYTAKQGLKKLLFKEHPYSNSKYGTLSAVENITRNDVVRYIKDNFAKDNIVISTVGSTRKEELIKLLDKYLYKLPSKRSKVKKIPIKNDFGPPENKHIFMDIPQSVILFGQKGIVYSDPNYYNASVLVNALGGMGLNSILMRELRHNLGITYGIRAYIDADKHGSYITGSMNTDSSTSRQSISAIKEVFSKVKEEGVDEQLFKDTKVSMVNSFIFSLFNSGNIITQLDHIQLNDFGHDYINNYVNYIENVKLDKVNELASSLLDHKNLFFVEVGGGTQK
ncbi:MAG: pitrilysin family protein [Wolbachia sp.]|nr:pitrilysin family protein [Wolbachia sp.]MDD9335974.1 pitrilysin family protein [Wolbachia sp.]